MIDKKQIITDFDKIIGNNQEVTDDTHMDLVDECADYTETLVNKLFIANVSQQRELLFAYEKMRTNHIIGATDDWRYSNVDLFIANNCG